MNKLAYLAISSSLLGLSSAFAQPQGGAPVPPQYVPAQGVAPAGGAPGAPHYAPVQGGAPVPHYAPAGGAPAPDPRGVRAPRTQAVDPGSANAPRLDPRVAPAPRR